MTEHSDDDELRRFEAHGAAPLPDANATGYAAHDGARIWYAVYGSGEPVVLLHGGLGNAEDWGYQVAALVASGYRAVAIDSRGHGRSTRDERPYSYERMARDVAAVMDALRLERAAFAGWSDGAIVALVLAMQAPQRVRGVFFFGGNMHAAGAKATPDPTPVVNRMFSRHVRDYARLSPTPHDFAAFVEAVQQMMKTQPLYGADELAQIGVPVTIVYGERDEFIRREHAELLARTIPGAALLVLPGVGHFAPLQRPADFNRALFAFVAAVAPST